MNRTITVAELVRAIIDIQDTGIAFLVLLIASVSVRMFVRIHMIKKFGPEDWAMLATFFISTAHIILSITNCHLAIEIANGNSKLLHLYNNMFRAAGATYIATLITVKISIGYFFIHIFSHQRYKRIAIYAMMILSTLLGIAYLPLGNFSCAQFKVFPGVTKSCPAPVQHAASILFVAFSIVNIGSDFALALMGCFALWQAKLPILTKISASLLLCLGSMGGVASTVRLAIWFTPADLAKYSQETLALVRWILIELAFSVIAANLAMIRPLFHAGLVKLGLITNIGTTNVTHQSAGGVKSNGPRPLRSGSDGDERLLSQSKQGGITVVVDTEMTHMSNPHRGYVPRIEQF
ncbi:hypothetical protein K461DRAFT_323279 [Myriangium duriaei CBS 260.36]|uniref:Rhodopsin domain-containing protein n=1 Tax=Myriangium duriaei CBS 260.36 TaxID=1168546 RepID=A0A9P4ITI7_9PEZI|nr:hypothetical protein K461DRAFT_323279 [Myriangium duriaei CBS 260.36]